MVELKNYTAVTHHEDGHPPTVNTFSTTTTDLQQAFIDFFLAESNLDEDEAADVMEDLYNGSTIVSDHLVFHSFEGTVVMYAK